MYFSKLLCPRAAFACSGVCIRSIHYMEQFYEVKAEKTKPKGRKLLVHLHILFQAHLCLSANEENEPISCHLIGLRKNGQTKEKWFVSVVVWRYFAVEEMMTVANTKLGLYKWGETLTLILTLFRFFDLVWNSSTYVKVKLSPKVRSQTKDIYSSYGKIETDDETCLLCCSFTCYCAFRQEQIFSGAAKLSRSSMY